MNCTIYRINYVYNCLDLTGNKDLIQKSDPSFKVYREIINLVRNSTTTKYLVLVVQFLRIL